MTVDDKAWTQLLLVGVPVLSLVGAWLALRAIGERRGRDGEPHPKRQAQAEQGMRGKTEKR